MKKLLVLTLALCMVASATFAGRKFINGVETESGGAVIGAIIDGATINSSAIGGTTPAAGTFTTLTSIPDGTNEVFQVNDGTIDFTDGAGGISGVLTIGAGGDWSYNKDIISSNGNIAGTTYGSDTTISDADLLSIDDGATTTIAVGGGVGSPIAWTTATGTGAPMRSITPAITFDTTEESVDAAVLTVAECSGTLVTNRGWDGIDDQTFTLPEADDSTADGLKFKLLAVVASSATADTYIDTEGATTNIYLNGIAIGDGERVWTQEIAVGESIVCHAATIDGSTYDWFCDAINGNWEDKGS